MTTRVLIEEGLETQFKHIDTIQLEINIINFEEYFILPAKTCAGNTAFSKSRTKLKLLFSSLTRIVLEGKDSLFVIDANECKKISLPSKIPYELHIAQSSGFFAILMPRGKGHIMGQIEYETGIIKIFEFGQRMRTIACCADYWLTVTALKTEQRKNESPQVFCVEKCGRLKWTKKILYGDFDFWAARVIISDDMSQLLVIDLKDMYVFDQTGELLKNINVRDFRKATKQTGFMGTEISRDDNKTLIYSEEINFHEYTSEKSRLFQYDFLTGHYYALRPHRKMLLACDSLSNRKWILSLPAGLDFFPKSKGSLLQYIVLAGRTGHVVVADLEGKILLYNQLPVQIDEVSVSQDGQRLLLNGDYEYDIVANRITKIESLMPQSSLIFSDKKFNYYYDKDSYLWIMNPNQIIMISKEENLELVDKNFLSQNNKQCADVPGEIQAKEVNLGFCTKWERKNENNILGKVSNTEECFTIKESCVDIEKENIDEELYRELIKYYNCPLSKAELSELVAILKRAAQLGPEAYYSFSSPNCYYGRIYLRRQYESQMGTSHADRSSQILVDAKKCSKSEKEFLFNIVDAGFDMFHYYEKLVILLSKEKNYEAALEVVRKWFKTMYWMFADYSDFYARIKTLESAISRSLHQQPAKLNREFDVFKFKVMNGIVKDIDKELFRRCKNNEPSFVKLLAENGANINAKDGKKHSSLYYALDSGYYELCEMMLDLGANPNEITETFQRRNALLLAVDRGIDFVKLLIEHGVDVQAYHDYDRLHTVYMTPLFKAIEECRSDVAKYLLDYAVDINYGIRGAFAERINSPLVQAIKNNDVDLVAYLINKGADVNYVAQAVCQDGSVCIAAPILTSIVTGNIEIVKLLIHCGVDLNTKFSGSTRLHGHLYVLLKKQTAQDFAIRLLTELSRNSSDGLSAYKDIAELLS